MGTDKIKEANSEQREMLPEESEGKNPKEKKNSGISQNELAALLGMSEGAFAEFKKRYPVLSDLPEETEESLKVMR